MCRQQFWPEFFRATSCLADTCFWGDSSESIEVLLRHYPPLFLWSLGRLQIPTLGVNYTKPFNTCHRIFNAVITFGSLPNTIIINIEWSFPLMSSSQDLGWRQKCLLNWVIASANWSWPKHRMISNKKQMCFTNFWSGPRQLSWVSGPWNAACTDRIGSQMMYPGVLEAVSLGEASPAST